MALLAAIVFLYFSVFAAEKKYQINHINISKIEIVENCNYKNICREAQLINADVDIDEKIKTTPSAQQRKMYKTMIRIGTLKHESKRI